MAKQTEQQFHIETGSISDVTFWLDTLVTEILSDSSKMHEIQHFQVIGPLANRDYVGVVLCNHTEEND